MGQQGSWRLYYSLGSGARDQQRKPIIPQKAASPSPMVAVRAEIIITAVAITAAPGTGIITVRGIMRRGTRIIGDIAATGATETASASSSASIDAENRISAPPPNLEGPENRQAATLGLSFKISRAYSTITLGFWVLVT
jgi:hypothetical protein